MTTQNTPKIKLTTPEINAIRILMSDHYSTIHQYDAETMPQFYARLGHLTAMLDGQVPFEGVPSYVELPPLEEKKGEQLFTHKFYALRDNMRALKMLLRQNMGLLHDPHTMTTDDPAIIYGSVRSSAAAALRCYEANRETILGYTRRQGKEEVILVNPHRATVSAAFPQVQEEDGEDLPAEEIIDEAPAEAGAPETFGDVLEEAAPETPDEDEVEDEESSIQEVAPLYETSDDDLSDV